MQRSVSLPKERNTYPSSKVGVATGLGSRNELAPFSKNASDSVNDNRISWVSDIDSGAWSSSSSKSFFFLGGILVVRVIASSAGGDTSTKVQWVVRISKGSNVGDGKCGDKGNGVEELHVDDWLVEGLRVACLCFAFALAFCCSREFDCETTKNRIVV